jgi:hypothetical protein
MAYFRHYIFSTLGRNSNKLQTTSSLSSNDIGMSWVLDYTTLSKMSQKILNMIFRSISAILVQLYTIGNGLRARDKLL